MDYFALFKYQYLPFTPPLTDRQVLLTPLATFNSVLLATAGIIYQVRATTDREIDFKIHEQRKETYEGLLRIMERLLEMYQKKDQDFISKIEGDWRALRPKLIIYASEEVMHAYKAIEKSGSEQIDGTSTIKRIAKLYRQIRSELGFAERDVPDRLMLSFLITDIYDTKYNGLFNEDGYFIDI